MERSENECREAVDLLCQLLVSTFSKPAQNVRGARGQYIIALRHLALFLQFVGGDELASRRFAELAFALSDIQYGAHPELLRITSPGGRPIDPTDVWLVRCHAAVALEFLVRGGLSEEEATDHIVKNCPSINNVIRDSKRDAKTSLVYWRKALTEKSIKNDVAIAAFNEELKLLDGLSSLPSSMFGAMGMQLTKQLHQRAAGLTGKSQTP